MRSRTLAPCAALAALLAAGTALSQAPKKADREFTVVNIEYKGSKVWVPGTLIVRKGERVRIKLVNNAPSGVHGYAIDEFKVMAHVAEGTPQEVEFTADKEGLFRVYCDMHPAHIGGQILVLK